MINIHPNLQTKILIKELQNTFVLFENNRHFPWIILAYKENVKNMLALTTQERLELMLEIEICEKIMQKIYNPIQTNIAIFGNQTPWLHIHIIARKEDDATFPRTAFEVKPENYTKEDLEKEVLKLKSLFNECE